MCRNQLYILPLATPQGLSHIVVWSWKITHARKRKPLPEHLLCCNASFVETRHLWRLALSLGLVPKATWYLHSVPTKQSHTMSKCVNRTCCIVLQLHSCTSKQNIMCANKSYVCSSSGRLPEDNTRIQPNTYAPAGSLQLRASSGVGHNDRHRKGSWKGLFLSRLPPSLLNLVRNWGS